MKKNQWPICPSFISLANGKAEESADFNNDGIYYPDYIRGFLADLSHDKGVRNALSMFQVVPKEFVPLDENNPPESTNYKFRTVLDNIPIDKRIIQIIGEDKKIIRIDSGTFINNGVCCDIFRNCKCPTTQTGEYSKIEFCYKQDCRSGIFADDSLNSFLPNSDVYKKRLQEIIDRFNDDEENPISRLKLKETKGRIYVHYTCSVSLFEETMFPIYAKGKFVACLMLGQMAAENYNKNESFRKFLEENHLDDSVCKEIFNKLPDHKLQQDEWVKKLNAIVVRINIFEERLEVKINHHCENYIKEEFRKIKEQFNSCTQSIQIKDNNSPEKFYNALSQALTSIHDTFDADNGGFMRIFALPMDADNNNYLPIGWSEPAKGGYTQCQTNYYFKAKPLNLLKFDNLRLSNEQKAEVVVEKTASKEIQKKFNKEKDFIRIEKLIDDSISFIVWKRHTNSAIKNDKAIFNVYTNALISFYSIAFQSYSYIRGAKMEYMLETTIRTTAHESSHFILPALKVMEKKMNIIPEEMIISTFIENYSKLKDVYEHYKENVIELLNQLLEINNRPTLIFKEVIPEKEETQVFPLLYKMTKMMSDKAYENNHQIIYSQNDNYVAANLDPVYFNHAIFNVIDNAIKYGYEGSYIYMNMHKTSEELIVKVTSYGHEIEKGRRVYKLFERGVDYKEVKGMGIGMFIVDKICKAHKGSINHESNLISSLNLPVLNAYICTCNEYLLRELNKEEKEIINREKQIIDSDTLNKVVYNSKFIKRPNAFASRIFKSTFENIFTIKLPI